MTAYYAWIRILGTVELSSKSYYFQIFYDSKIKYHTSFSVTECTLEVSNKNKPFIRHNGDTMTMPQPNVGLREINLRTKCEGPNLILFQVNTEKQ